MSTDAPQWASREEAASMQLRRFSNAEEQLLMPRQPAGATPRAATAVSTAAAMPVAEPTTCEDDQVQSLSWDVTSEEVRLRVLETNETVPSRGALALYKRARSTSDGALSDPQLAVPTLSQLRHGYSELRRNVAELRERTTPASPPVASARELQNASAAGPHVTLGPRRPSTHGCVQTATQVRLGDVAARPRGCGMGAVARASRAVTAATPPSPTCDGVADSVEVWSRKCAQDAVQRDVPRAATPQRRSHTAHGGGDARVGSPGVNRGRARDGRIRVVVRKRPVQPLEAGVDCVRVDGATVRLCVARQRVDLSEYTESNEFAFDAVFDEHADNATVHRACAQELITVALQGGRASCFAYGQTGSGKTHTMMGDTPDDGDAAEGGLYLLGAQDLFARLPERQSVSVAFYEIYCNSLFDLLHDRRPVVLREDATHRVHLCGLSWHAVRTPKELRAMVGTGLAQRRTGSTSANERSSRSHAVLTLSITDDARATCGGVLNYVDLAGSERATDTAHQDRQTRLEGAEINKSLLALKECIRALDEKRRHVPLRGSKLTEVLRDSFVGNSCTVMIAHVSPTSANHEHTANTLRYAFRVKGLSVPTVSPSRARNAPRSLFSAPPVRREVTAESSTAPRTSIGVTRPRQASPCLAAASRSPTRASRTARRSSSARRHVGSPGVAAGTTSWEKGMSALSAVAPTASHTAHATPWIGPSEAVIACEASAAEAELKRRVLQQLQRDLGGEIQRILDERDAIIGSLRRENAELRRQVRELQGGALADTKAPTHAPRLEHDTTESPCDLAP